MNPTLQSAIRHLLTAVGVLVVEKGYASESLTTAIVGAVVALIGSVWGPLDEWIADRKAKRAAELELIRAQTANLENFRAAEISKPLP